jgi:hypothetical protein
MLDASGRDPNIGILINLILVLNIVAGIQACLRVYFADDSWDICEEVRIG